MSLCKQCGSNNPPKASFCAGCGNPLAVMDAGGSSEVEKLPPVSDAALDSWYYEEKGQRNGPISRTEVVNLIRAQRISYGSFVWKKGYQDWTKIENTELLACLQKMEVLPPLSGAQVNNTYMWLLAFAPVISEFIGLFIVWLIGIVMYDVVISTYYEAQILADEFWYMIALATISLNVFLCWRDEIVLKKAGHNTEKFGGFWILLVPVYMYKRSKCLNQNQACLIVWVICLFLSSILF